MLVLAPTAFLAIPEQLQRVWPRAEALALHPWLATHHYENFQVVSFLLPKRLHQDFYNVYAFCRWADDLGDEIGDTRESLRLLAWWRARTSKHVRGRRRASGVCRAGGTARSTSFPIEPFDDLISAFEQDQTVTRYRNLEELFEYCRYSANPWAGWCCGLCGYRDAERQALSDATCTALQLANFWQDVTVDLGKGSRLSAAGRAAQHGSRSSECRAPVRPGIPRRHERGGGRGARAVSQRPAAGRAR